MAIPPHRKVENKSAIKFNMELNIFGFKHYNGERYIAKQPWHVALKSAKAGLVMLSEQMSLEWGKLGIRVNAVSPGFIDAGMSASHYQDSEERKKREAMVPIQRIGTADDIAKVVMFLLSEDSSYIHGENILVDGGVMNSVLANIGRS